MLFLLLLPLLAGAAFLSETRLVPFLRNNITFFEAGGALFILGTLLNYYKHKLSLKSHPLITIMLIWFLLATVSLIKLPPYRFPRSAFDYILLSTSQTSIFLFQFFLTLTVYNFFVRYPAHFTFFLRSFAVALAIVGVWVVVDQYTSPGNFNAVGPFKTRSHMGIYTMGGFWILLIYLFWPKITGWERIATYPIVGLLLYAIAVSMRQSIYTAFLVGIAGLVLSFFFVQGRARLSAFTFAFAIIAAGALIFFYGEQYFSQVYYFRREFLGLQSRLEEAAVISDDPTEYPGFDALQRAGVFRAFRENPILGIGWQGFYHSDYSPTGHEVHSTPFRFLAELGLPGIFSYLVYLGLLFAGALRLFLLARRTPYQLSVLMLLLGLGTSTVSHYYNRMFTDRPYWLLLIIYLVLENMLREQQPAPAEGEAEIITTSAAVNKWRPEPAGLSVIRKRW
jgi:hypothetical protein